MITASLCGKWARGKKVYGKIKIESHLERNSWETEEVRSVLG